tara:strand:- start:83 stop:313 length:231 start_codon:yes stop_codon:yes gene_type:complete
MVQNKKKFKHGMQKITLAISCAFTGPIIFVLSNNKMSNLISSILSISGLILMIICVISGFLGIRNLLESFFDKPNE